MHSFTVLTIGLCVYTSGTWCRVSCTTYQMPASADTARLECQPCELYFVSCVRLIGTMCLRCWAMAVHSSIHDIIYSTSYPSVTLDTIDSLLFGCKFTVEPLPLMLSVAVEMGHGRRGGHLIYLGGACWDTPWSANLASRVTYNRGSSRKLLGSLRSYQCRCRSTWPLQYI